MEFLKAADRGMGGLQTASQTPPEPQSLLSALSPLRPSFPLHSFIPEYADPSLRPSDEQPLGLEHSSLTHCLADSFLFSLGRFSPAPTSSSPHYTLSYPLPGMTVGSSPLSPHNGPKEAAIRVRGMDERGCARGEASHPLEDEA